ncbi:phosphotransferase [Streptomyces sp. CAU 1734]|uniref:phosphotransferase n=1 Tax=Streptomyces sp. CAU 1734 TaxID=3140360 RepID=UPI00326081A7
MKEQPQDVGDNALRHTLRAWGIDPVRLAYAPVGFGDHHWTASGGGDWFVTVADLEHKDHCGAGAEAAWRGLRRAMDTAALLRESGPLPFVLAPLRTPGGETVRRMPGGRYAMSVFPLVTAVAGEFGQRLPAERRARVVEILAALHRMPVPRGILVIPSAPPGAGALERALREPSAAVPAGPFTEPAAELLAASRGALRRRLGEFGRRAAALAAGGGEPVVTHGEPHPGNLLWDGRGRPLLADWDTVGLASPERDLWLAAAGPEDLDRWSELTGRRPDPSALALHRLRWDLADTAEFLSLFRAPHTRGADTEEAWRGFTGTVERLVAG